MRRDVVFSLRGVNMVMSREQYDALNDTVNEAAVKARAEGYAACQADVVAEVKNIMAQMPHAFASTAQGFVICDALQALIGCIEAGEHIGAAGRKP